MSDDKDPELMRAQKAVLDAMHASQKAHRRARREQTITDLMDGNKFLRTVGLIAVLVIVGYVFGGGGALMLSAIGH